MKTVIEKSNQVGYPYPILFLPTAILGYMGAYYMFLEVQSGIKVIDQLEGWRYVAKFMGVGIYSLFILLMFLLTPFILRNVREGFFALKKHVNSFFK